MNWSLFLHACIGAALVAAFGSPSRLRSGLPDPFSTLGSFEGTRDAFWVNRQAGSDWHQRGVEFGSSTHWDTGHPCGYTAGFDGSLVGLKGSVRFDERTVRVKIVMIFISSIEWHFASSCVVVLSNLEVRAVEGLSIRGKYIL